MFRLTLALASLGCSIPLLADAQTAPPAAPIAYVAPAPVAPTPPATAAAPSTPPSQLTAKRVEERKRRGVTVELNAGGGRLRTSYFGDSYEEGNGGAVDVGVGWWRSDRLAIMGRANYIQYSNEEGYGNTYEPAKVWKLFVGASAQYWITDRLWGSAGLGVGQIKVTSEQNLGFPLTARGVGLDLRLGVTPVTWDDGALNLSLVLNPLWTTGYREIGDGSWMGLSSALFLGFQFL